MMTDTREDFESRRPQFIAALTANIAAISAGCVIGWTSPSLPKLELDNIDQNKSAWISSLMPLAAVFGPFLAGFLAEEYGRKNSLLMSSVLILISWFCLAFTRSFIVLCIGRLIAGLFVGWVFTVLPMYCSEIAQISIRGAIGSLLQVFICVGILFEYVVGPFASYEVLSLSGLVFPIFFLLSFAFMPESPYYLLGANRIELAKKSFMKLRDSCEDDVSQEFKNMQADVENAKSQTGKLKDIFATKGTTKALIISCGLVGFQQFSGINVVLFNAQSLFANGNSEISAIITGVVMLLASAATPFIVDRVGRKPLLIVSAVGMAVCHAILGLCYMNIFPIGYITVLSIIAVVVYIIVYAIGFGPLPWAVMGEIFPSNIKSLASTLTASLCWFLAFVVTILFSYLSHLIGLSFTFWLFGVYCVAAAYFVYFLLPETSGRSLAEIQEILNS